MNPNSFDVQLTEFIRLKREFDLTPLMRFIDYWGMGPNMVLWVFVAAIIFYLAAYKREALFLMLIFVADAINVFFKILFNRARPEEMVIFPKFQQASFPSGHVVHYVSFFGFLLALMLIHKHIPKLIRYPLSFFCIFLLMGVGVSRVYLGTHWPTDILAAYLLGGVLLFGIIYLYKKASIPMPP